jgi:exopolysaccharide production protein ExoY
MSKTSARGGTVWHAAKTGSCISATGIDPSEPSAPWAQPRGVDRHWPVGGRKKRAFDLVFAMLALVLLAPISILVAVLVRIGLGRPILVAENRIGFGGRIFRAYTFRTAPTHGAHRLASDPPIATCLRTLRDAGLDLLPQLLSVLRGDMSFVGPRPVTLDEADRPGLCALDYLRARPGLVALRPADRAGNFGHARRAALDRYYVRRWSIWLDLALLANAVAAVHRAEDAD